MMFGHSHSTTLSTPDTNSCSFRIRGASSGPDHREVSDQNVYYLRDRSQHTFYSAPRLIVLSLISWSCLTSRLHSVIHSSTCMLRRTLNSSRRLLLLQKLLLLEGTPLSRQQFRQITVSKLPPTNKIQKKKSKEHFFKSPER